MSNWFISWCVIYLTTVTVDYLNGRDWILFVNCNTMTHVHEIVLHLGSAIWSYDIVIPHCCVRQVVVNEAGARIVAVSQVVASIDASCVPIGWYSSMFAHSEWILMRPCPEWIAQRPNTNHHIALKNMFLFPLWFSNTIERMHFGGPDLHSSCHILMLFLIPEHAPTSGSSDIIPKRPELYCPWVFRAREPRSSQAFPAALISACHGLEREGLRNYMATLRPLQESKHPNGVQRAKWHRYLHRYADENQLPVPLYAWMSQHWPISPGVGCPGGRANRREFYATSSHPRTWSEVRLHSLQCLIQKYCS